MSRKILPGLFIVLAALLTISGLHATPVSPSSSQPWSFRDDFNYASIDQLQAAGWSTNMAAPASYYSIGNGILSMQNDGYVGASIAWNTIPANVSDWSVSLRGEWTGNTVGSIGIDAQTVGHSYEYLADGYYPRFGFGRDGIGASIFPGYAPQLNVWHVLQMDMVQRTLYMYFDGSLVGTYVETDATPGNTNLATIAVSARWMTDNSFDWVQASEIRQPYLTIQASPSIISFSEDHQGSSTILIGSSRAFNGTVTLSASVTPAGPSLALNPASFSLSGGSSQTASLSVSAQDSVSPGSYSIAITATSPGLSRSVNVTAVFASFPFHDNFNYTTIDQLRSAGWSINQAAPLSYYSVGSGILTLKNDGSQGAAISWTSIPPGVTDWGVSTRGSWVGNNVGSIGLSVQTKGHGYQLLADGYYPRFGLGRDGVGVATFPGYNPQMNVWHILRMDMVEGTLHLFFDGAQVGSYIENDTTPGSTNLTGASIAASWETNDSFDWIQIGPADPQIQQTSMFDGFSVSLSGGLLVSSSSKTVSGSVSVNVADNAGQIIFSKTFNPSVIYGSSNVAIFTLKIPLGSLWLAASCTVTISADKASCMISKNPDVDHDGLISIVDLATIALSYGASTSDAKYVPADDLNMDGQINVLDLAIVAVDFNVPAFS